MIRFIKSFFNKFKEYFLLVFLLLVSLIFISFNNKPQINKVKTFAIGGFAFFTSSVNSFFELFDDDEELEKLRAQNAELMLEVNLLREEALENKELKSLIGLKDSVNFDIIPTSIISKLVSKNYGNFIVDSGLSDSVKIGMPVINTSGLVGIVTEVTGNYSVVRPLRNLKMNLAVKVQRTGVVGILEWSGNKFKIKNVPASYDVAVNDKIVTSDFSTIFPPAIPVGVVTEKEINISGLLSNIVIDPHVDFNSIKNIYILKVIPDKEIEGLKLNLMKK